MRYETSLNFSLARALALAAIALVRVRFAWTAAGGGAMARRRVVVGSVIVAEGFSSSTGPSAAGEVV